jgi:hypothetical protein
MGAAAILPTVCGCIAGCTAVTDDPMSWCLIPKAQPVSSSAKQINAGLTNCILLFLFAKGDREFLVEWREDSFGR